MPRLPEQALIAATDAAIAELHVQTIEDIQRSTAFTWAGRALAAYHFFAMTGDVRWLLDAADYAHEGLEHASLHPDPAVLNVVRPALLAAADHALTHHVFAQVA